MKTLWLTSLISSEEMVKTLMSQLKNYGLELKGHFWADDLEKMAWMGARNELLDSNIGLWAVLTSDKELQKPSIRYGLSLLAMSIQAQRGNNFPIVVLQTQGDAVSSKQFTTPLINTDVLSVSNPVLAAKLVARVHAPAGDTMTGYRLDCFGNPHIGQWFEIGPATDLWQGAMFGVAGAEINFHAVGARGRLPEKSTLNYPVKGLQLQLGQREYSAWAVQNELSSQDSYYLKVEGYPESIVFGAYTRQDVADVYVVNLK
ncbi:MAG: hypothetical protein JW920_07910 [Deltaproteobacteria bacterium]|nr:hypothetical protein [Deltaproteobacteria bacterium]